MDNHLAKVGSGWLDGSGISSHTNTPGFQRTKAPMDPAPYVDALGNPWPPIRKLDDRPNIKERPGRTVGDGWRWLECYGDMMR